MVRLRVAVKLNFRPYIRRYTSPNENFEYSYPLNLSPTKNGVFLYFGPYFNQNQSPTKKFFFSIFALILTKALPKG